MFLREVYLPAYACWLIAIFLSTLFLTYSLLPYQHYNDFDENTCYIVNVTSPTQLPSYNNTYGWRECNCGKRCVAWTPCISLYSQLNPNVVIQEDVFRRNQDTQCTFFDDKCPNGEDARYTLQKMEEAQQTLSKYLHKNVSCYTNDNNSEIYLNKSYKYQVIIILSVLMGLLLFCCVCHICCNVYESHLQKQKQKQKTIIVEHDIESYPYPVKDQEL